MNRALLRLREKGVLDTLKNKWWVLHQGGGACSSSSDSGSSYVSQIGADNLSELLILIVALKKQDFC